MIDTTYPGRQRSYSREAIVRALTSITLKQADIVAGIVRASGQGWGVQVADDYDGYRSIYIDLIIGDKQKSFFIAGTAQCLELFEMHGDDLALMGTFADIDALGRELTSLVGPQ